jgi:hypothetical protein
MEPVLCYVNDPWAHFTTNLLDEQWGDDWNDVPYEHNAGNPYTPIPGRDEEGAWQIVKVAFEGDFREPCDGHLNSPYSVKQINTGAVPWLRSWDDPPAIQIWAGMPLSEFMRTVEAEGGTVYLPRSLAEPFAVCSFGGEGLVDG